jgi:SAM-dependent methyltransferase
VVDVRANENLWGRDYPWEERGDEWSKRWGGPVYQWWATLYPRVCEFVPTGTILEIAPGQGRWTQYLLPLCDRLIGVDVAASCVKACRERFAIVAHAEFHKNDGMSLPMVPDGEVGFAFSFDSLVHCERDVIESYLGELARKLTADGVAFLHHSNLGHYRHPETGELPFPNRGMRAESMSAELFAELCGDAGLVCIGQEVVRWKEDEDWFRDCISMVTRPGSKFARDNRVIVNGDFAAQAKSLRKLAKVYGAKGFPHRAR